MPSGPRLVFLVIESKNLAAESKEFIHLQSDSNRWPPDSSTEGIDRIKGHLYSSRNQLFGTGSGPAVNRGKILT